MKQSILTAVLLSLLFVNELPAQEVPSSWSIDLYGGSTFGQFTHKAEMTPHGGINLRYSLNPVVSLYGNTAAGQFKSPENTNTGSFQNDYYTFGVGARTNVLRMIAGPSSLTNSLGVYTHTGLNFIHNNVDVYGTELSGYPSQNYTGYALLFRLGGGLSIRLSRRLDFFAQAVFNVSNSDLLDGHERASGTRVPGTQAGGDAFLNTSAGLTFKFSSKNVSHADWYERDHRIDPLARSMAETLQRIETELDLTHNSMDNMQERIQMFERSLDDLGHIVTTIHSDQFIEYHSQIESLQTRLQLLQAELEELSGRVENRTVVTGEKRYFVVAGVFRTMERAELLLGEIRRQGFNEAEIIRDRSRNYFLVNYSGHASEAAAAAKLDRIRTDVNPESWVYIR